MAISHVLSLYWSRNGETINNQVTISADGEDNRDIVLSGNATNVLVAMGIDVSQLQAIYISSDYDCTLKTNSSGSPDQTLNIAGGKPFMWVTGSGITNPLTTDVTSLYLSNGSANSNTVKIRVSIDSTV